MRIRPLIGCLSFGLTMILADCSAVGQTILREYWLGLPGSALADLTNSANFPDFPTGKTYPDIFEAPSEWADEYGTRMRGYVRPPTTGTYVFWISGDDQSQLLLSTDEDPAHQRPIARVITWTASRVWEEPRDGNNLVQKSAGISLQAGRKYYIEALQKEGGGGDNLAVGWRLPNGTLERPIPGNRLSAFQVSTNPPTLLAEPADLDVAEGEPAVFQVTARGLEPMAFQWQQDGVNLPEETTPTYIVPVVMLADSGTKFRCIITNQLGSIVSREATLTVHPETTPPTVRILNPPANVTVRNLTQVEVTFSEPVTGVDAADLLINGQPATNLIGAAMGPYIFQFARPPVGPVQFFWKLNHGIADTALIPNLFAGGAWGVALNPNLEAPGVVVNELVVANENGLLDEDAEPQDWIEIYNPGPAVVNLAGWSLTDEAGQPDQWIFPAITLGSGRYLLVFASGKDRRPTAANAKLHTNFKLGKAGEYLGLFNAESPRQAVSELVPQFPEQRNDYSYGRDRAGEWRYFAKPTPGAANGLSAIEGVLPPPHFSVQRGFFGASFNLILNTKAEGAVIRYTRDGSEPTEAQGLLYTAPIPISATTLLRAATFQTNYLPSVVVTHTYLFGVTAQRRTLPALSIVTGTNHLRGPTGIMGISGGTYANGVWQRTKSTDYHNPSKHGLAWERPTSVELIRADSDDGFQADCGIRIQGSDWLRPRLTVGSKFSFRFYFRGDYGLSKLKYPLFGDSPVQTFDQIVLRAGHNDDTNPFIKDELMRRLFIDTGQVGSHGMFGTLFVNGQYKGYYNPVERIEKNFCRAWHGGSENWDVLAQGGDPLDGDAVEWNALRSFITSRNFAVPDNYLSVARRFDLVNFIDYLLVNIYGANGDWPHNNWRAARERAPDGTLRFYIWDAEFALGTYGRAVTHNTFTEELNGTSEIASFYRALRASPEFKLLFADRIQKHFFNNGALTDANVTNHFLALRKTMSGVIPSMDSSILTVWVPRRRGAIMTHFNSAGLLASSNAPAFNRHGGRVPQGFVLSMSATNGTIYYTTNGLDPRVPFAGAVALGARTYTSNQPVQLSRSVLVKARTLKGTNWSALAAAAFQVAELGPPLRITEIMYNPPGGDAYEFIELQNVGTIAWDLSGMSFEGIDFTFAENTTLAAGAVLVLGSKNDPGAFLLRYPTVKVAGQFGGSLSNGGERVALKDRQGVIVMSVDYDDAGGWPMGADGAGYSLEIIDPGADPDDPANWRASSRINGSPGLIDSGTAIAPAIVLNEVMAENLTAVPFGDAYPDWVELHNATDQEVSLAGWSLSDDVNPRKFVFPPDAKLVAGGCTIVWCDNQTNAPGWHAGFMLGRQGESLFLYDATTNRVDGVTYGLQVADYSVGRIGDRWLLTVPTPGEVNRAALTGSPTNLVINEWLANAATGDSDWIELHNRDQSSPVPLQGLYLTTSNAVHRIGSLSFVAPGGFVQLLADEQPGADHLDFKLPASGNLIGLYDDAGAQMDRITYGLQSEGVSEGRYPDGGTNVTRFMGSASPGASNYLPVYLGPVLNELMAWNENAVVDPYGGKSDWLELYNPSSEPFDLSGMSLSVGSPEAGQWVFPDGTAIGARGYLVIWCDGARPASTSLEADLNLGNSLSSTSGGVYLFNRLKQLVDQVEYGFQITDLSVGRNSGSWNLLASPTPGSANSAVVALGQATGLRLNEWLVDSINEDDWFEMFNPNSQPVSLMGLYLTDDPSLAGQTKFKVRPLSFIPAQGWVQWIADGAGTKGFDHLNFTLDSQGETLRIYDFNTNIIDSVDFGPQQPGVSEGRLPDGGTAVVRFPASPTPRESNYLPLTNLVINEVLTHTDPPLEDAIELHNLTSDPIPLGGWFISNSENNLKKYRIPDGTILPAQGYLVFYEQQFNASPGVPSSFTLNSAHGDEAVLSSADAAGNLTGYRTVVRFGAAENGVSFGRHRTSAGVDFVALSRRSFGVDAPASLAEFRLGNGVENAAPQTGPVVINEIMYHPAEGPNAVENSDLEFIELFNITETDVPLYDPIHPQNAWRLGNAVDFVFPRNVVLPANSHLLVVGFDPGGNAASLEAFRSQYNVSTNTPIFGPWKGKLANSRQSVELFKPDPPQQPPHPDAGFVPYILVDRVEYRDQAPWSPEADGSGASLQRLNSGAYGNEPLHWTANSPTAGRANDTRLSDTDQDGLPNSWENAYGLDPNDNRDAALDADGDGLTALQEYLSGTDPRDPQGYLQIEIGKGEPGRPILRFRAAAGKTYSVLYRDSATGGPWQKLFDVGASASAQTIERADATALGREKRFYRLVTPAMP